MKTVTDESNSHALYTIIICTLNEEENIGDCIEAIRIGTDNKIIVVDADSKDNTKKIALSYNNVNFFIYPQNGIASQRNYAISLVKTPYLFFIDADDRVNPDFMFKYKPRILLFSNTTGARINVEALKFAKAVGLAVISFVSEGLYANKRELLLSMFWGIIKIGFYTKICTWNGRSATLI